MKYTMGIRRGVEEVSENKVGLHSPMGPSFCFPKTKVPIHKLAGVQACWIGIGQLPHHKLLAVSGHFH